MGQLVPEVPTFGWKKKEPEWISPEQFFGCQQSGLLWGHSPSTAIRCGSIELQAVGQFSATWGQQLGFRGDIAARNKQLGFRRRKFKTLHNGSARLSWESIQQTSSRRPKADNGEFFGMVFGGNGEALHPNDITALKSCHENKSQLGLGNAIKTYRSENITCKIRGTFFHLDEATFASGLDL